MNSPKVPETGSLLQEKLQLAAQEQGACLIETPDKAWSQFGFEIQVPQNICALWNAPSATLNLGEWSAEVRHAPEVLSHLNGTRAGAAACALWTLEDPNWATELQAQGITTEQAKEVVRELDVIERAAVRHAACVIGMSQHIRALLQ